MNTLFEVVGLHSESVVARKQRKIDAIVLNYKLHVEYGFDNLTLGCSCECIWPVTNS